MPSRRKRKRYRRPADNAVPRGDRQNTKSIPPPSDLGFNVGGEGGPLCGDWENASLSDLRLLRHAIKQNWPVPSENRGPLMAAVFAQLRRQDATNRLLIAACEVAVAAVEHNLKLDLRESRSRRDARPPHAVP